MLGLMQNAPLLLTDILRQAVRNFPDQEVVTRLVEGGIHRYTFKDASKRIAKAAHALTAMGVQKGDRIGVIGWNTHRQLELYYAISCIGAICHTINPRLGPENAGYVIGHAENKAIFYDATFAPLVAGIAKTVDCVERYVELCPEGTVTDNGLGADSYEALIADHPEEFDWPTFDENTACSMCYTSGTTGKPKGVLFSHRALVLETIVSCLPTGLGCSRNDTVLPVVPMFHVNAWGVPYSALLIGMKLVMPGPGLDGENLHELIIKENVTYALGVPTVWLNLLAYIESKGLDLGNLRYSIVGGSALSAKIIREYDKYGVRTRQAWGMTEMSPLGTVNMETPGFYDLPEEERIALQLRQGQAMPFVDMRVVGPDGKELPYDGKSDGVLQVRGPWIIDRYYKADKPAVDEDNWFDTG
ncbi:MAG: AMP-binding protein, partial [Pseudomonadota bacterium]